MNSVKVFFITGTGTGVGKTVVSAALAHGLSQREGRSFYWKPVQTGPAPGDADVVAEQGGSYVTVVPTAFTFREPASPDQAAAAEGAAPPTISELQDRIISLPRIAGIVEGAGGLLVPLNDRAETWADFLRTVGLPVLIVAASGLGTLNHTTLTVEALHARGMEPLGVVLSGPPHPANVASLGRLLPGVRLHSFPEMPGLARHPAWAAECERLARFVLETSSAPPSSVRAGSVSDGLAAVAHASGSDPMDGAEISWLDADARHAWHPYTQHQTAPPPLAITRAQGVWLQLADGTRLLDGTSSWWVNTVGHGRPEIGHALATQQATLDHVLFAGATHEPAALLAASLAARAGHGLSRVFYSDNGSTAVEVALKIAYQSWANRGQPERRTFVAFRGSYHGDTFGAMSVSDAHDFHGPFRPFCFRVQWADLVTRHPSAVCAEGEAVLGARIATLAELLTARRQELAAVIVEPLLQGAAGMLVQPEAWLRALAELCQAHGLPLILDEVFTGLGRVGAPFAFQRAGIEPDLVCVAKGLTGGTLPLAVTLARETFFEAFLSDDRARALLHGHSYTANAISCRAALAALAIFDREDLAGRARQLEARATRWLNEDGRRLGVANPRALGGILAFELPGSAAGSYFDPRAAEVARHAAAEGLFLRPLGNTIYLAPPLAIADDEFEFALTALQRVVARST